jgi:hypothetical protein
MKWIPMAAQRADRTALIPERLLENLQFRWVVEHGQLAMRVPRIISGAQLHRMNI